MRFLGSAVAASSLIASAAATGVMVPLYVDPGDNGANWDSTVTAAKAGSSWTMIINPNNGPGGAPSASYQAGMKSFSALSNVVSVGYIHTSWAARSTEDIQSDLDAWKSWGSDIKGIFYDEASVDNADNIKQITDMARQTLGSDAMTICNFGTTPPESFYDDCSVVVAFEDTASNYQGTATLDKIFPAGKAGQGAVIVNSFSGSADEIKTDFEQMNTAGVAWGFFCAAADYNTATSLISENAAGAAGGNAPSPQQSSGPSTDSPTSTGGPAPTGFITSVTKSAPEPTQSASDGNGGDGGDNGDGDDGDDGGDDGSDNGDGNDDGDDGSDNGDGNDDGDDGSDNGDGNDGDDDSSSTTTAPSANVTSSPGRGHRGSCRRKSKSTGSCSQTPNQGNGDHDN